jgi:hypothetical protein
LGSFTVCTLTGTLINNVLAGWDDDKADARLEEVDGDVPKQE